METDPDTETDDVFFPSWYPYDGGATINQRGPAHGYILRDEEFGDPDDEEESDARLTLEQGSVGSPGYILTATLYGWMYHFHRVQNEAEAHLEWEAMRENLEKLADLLPYEEDRKKVDDKARVLTEAIADYELSYP